MRRILLVLLIQLSCFVCFGQNSNHQEWDARKSETIKFLRDTLEGATAKSEFSTKGRGSFFSTAVLAVFVEGAPCRLSIRQTTLTRQASGRDREDTTRETVSYLDLSKAAPDQVKTQQFNPHVDAEASARRQGLEITQEGSPLFEVVVPAAEPGAFRIVETLNGTQQPETRGAIASLKVFSSAEKAVRVAEAVRRLANLCTGTQF